MQNAACPASSIANATGGRLAFIQIDHVTHRAVRIHLEVMRAPPQLRCRSMPPRGHTWNSGNRDCKERANMNEAMRFFSQ